MGGQGKEQQATTLFQMIFSHKLLQRLFPLKPQIFLLLQTFSPPPPKTRLSVDQQEFVTKRNTKEKKKKVLLIFIRFVLCLTFCGSNVFHVVVFFLWAGDSLDGFLEHKVVQDDAHLQNVQIRGHGVGAECAARGQLGEGSSSESSVSQWRVR